MGSGCCNNLICEITGSGMVQKSKSSFRILRKKIENSIDVSRTHLPSLCFSLGSCCWDLRDAGHRTAGTFGTAVTPVLCSGSATVPGSGMGHNVTAFLGRAVFLILVVFGVGYGLGFSNVGEGDCPVSQIDSMLLSRAPGITCLDALGFDF